MMKKIGIFILAAAMLVMFCACGNENPGQDAAFATESTVKQEETTEGSAAADISGSSETEVNRVLEHISENFVPVLGGTFQMGSPESEAWRSEDETQHTVTVSDFYMSIYEVTQAEYREIMGENPSSFSGDDLPVENVSWLDAVRYCNARSEKEGLTPVY
ncbi:MAG: formylglycine-generating enzyme family protein, partial [Alistipes sp.]|nr:formylglycine-generating enzyme family protein [Alistipes sp.]